MSLSWLGARIAGWGAWIRSAAPITVGWATSARRREEQRLLGDLAQQRRARLAQPRLILDAALGPRVGARR